MQAPIARWGLAPGRSRPRSRGAGDPTAPAVAYRRGRQPGLRHPAAGRLFLQGGPMIPILGEIIGWEALLVLGLIALLFGSSQLPKLARSIGQASRELRRSSGPVS